MRAKTAPSALLALSLLLAVATSAQVVTIVEMPDEDAKPVSLMYVVDGEFQNSVLSWHMLSHYALFEKSQVCCNGEKRQNLGLRGGGP